MTTINIINAFNDVDRKDIPSKEGVAGNTLIDRLASVQIGIGSKVFRADDSGIWLGAETFAAAPFSVDMLGNLVASSADFSGSGYTKLTIFKQDAIPEAVAVGDLWFDTNDSNKLYRAGVIGADQIIAGEWELVQDETIADAQATADSKVTTFLQDAVPTSISVGDIWIDTNDSNKMYRAASVGANEIAVGEWVLSSTVGVTIFAQAAIPTSTAIGDLWYDTDDGNKQYRSSSVGADQITAGEWVLVGSTGITVFAQAAIPTSLAVGDLWIDTDDGNKMYRAAAIGADQITAGEWVLVSTQGITVFAQAAIPTSTAVGDLWFDTDDSNKQYRAAAVGADQITAGEWELLATTGGITVFAQDAIPTSLAVGDLWYDTNDNNKPYRAAAVGANEVAAGEWVLINDLRAADALLKAGTSQALTGNFNLNDSNVLIDGANKRITISDGTNTRILIGYQSGGF